MNDEAPRPHGAPPALIGSMPRIRSDRISFTGTSGTKVKRRWPFETRPSNHKQRHQGTKLGDGSQPRASAGEVGGRRIPDAEQDVER